LINLYAYGVVPGSHGTGEKMAEALETLIEKAQRTQMTDGQLREQRLSFVSGKHPYRKSPDHAGNGR
jgi:hypothetical protein